MGLRFQGVGLRLEREFGLVDPCFSWCSVYNVNPMMYFLLRSHIKVEVAGLHFTERVIVLENTSSSELKHQRYRVNPEHRSWWRCSSVSVAGRRRHFFTSRLKGAVTHSFHNSCVILFAASSDFDGPCCEITHEAQTNQVIDSRWLRSHDETETFAFWGESVHVAATVWSCSNSPPQGHKRS